MFTTQEITRLIRRYYLATPLFLLAELLLDLKVRVAFPGDSAHWDYAYLAACFILGSFVFTGPLASALFGLIESAINIGLLIIDVMLPVMQQPALLRAGQPFEFGAEHLAHFFLVGGVLLFCLYANPLMRQRTDL